jgi:pimeloyl-ACP methyl ester carboxylesterase
MKDGTKICVREEEGPGKPIVLIHGWGLDRVMWDRQVSYLTERDYHVVAIDLRGFGNSDESKTDYSYQTWARDVGEVITDRGLEDVMLVGHSMGGAIAMHYVSKGIDPPVERLALVAAAGPCMTIRLDHAHGHPHEFFALMIAAIDKIPSIDRFKGSPERLAAFQQFFASSFLPVSLTAAWWPFDELYDMFLSASKGALTGGLIELRDRDLRQDIANIGVDTRICHGIWDILAPYALSDEQRSLIIGSIRRRFLWSGHGLFFEEEKKLNDELDAFARSIV